MYNLIDKEIKVELAKEKETKKPKVAEKKNDNCDDSCLMFVKNLPEDISNEQLEEHFPNSVSCRVARGPGGVFKGLVI